ncbi:MAG: hypothetical protein A2V66_10645 [Ignavibacteria bacterium RBG_13_36_8]|nr:MAG: hypothetical protein A2V66_10645 [Ignavibacteria bacterium RBG_13_36_8]
MKIKTNIFQLTNFVLYFLFFQIFCYAQGEVKSPMDDLYSKLKSLPGVYVKKINALPGFKEEFEIALVQPVDHKNPNGLKFTQRIFLSHRDYTKPIVLETEGYGTAWPKEKEITKILDANQIIVEHRYFESSKPKPLDWKYLTSWQAASDHHRIVELFKKIYPGKWLTTGRSKGGMAALFHRAYYPGDVDATIAYVAPIMIGPTDPRIEIFMNSVGDERSREKIKQFQRLCLQRKAKLLPFLEKYSKEQGLIFSCSLEEAFERIVIEFPYSFWSGNHEDDEIPNPDASEEQLFEYLNRVNSFSSISDANLKSNSPLYYQQYTELGYVNYPCSHLNELLHVLKDPHFSFYVPKDAPVTDFNSDTMPMVLNYLQNNGNNIIYLYGEFDIWTSCAVELFDKTNAIKLILKGKGHLFDIKDFPVSEKNIVYTALEDWLQLEINNR